MQAFNTLTLLCLTFIMGTSALVQDEQTQKVESATAQQTAAQQADAKPVPVKIAEAHATDIRKLLQANQELDRRYDRLVQGFTSLKKQVPGIKPEFWGEFEPLFDREKLGDELTQIYGKHFTHGEVKDILAFFESPTGKKFLAVGKTVLSESNTTTNEFGRSIGEKIGKKLDAAGFKR